MLTSPRGPRVDVPADRLISSIMSEPKTRATADWLRLFRAEQIRLAMDSVSDAAGNVVPRRVARRCAPWALVEGSTWNNALSWTSVSRIKAVMSCEPSSAFVKMRGGWNLEGIML